MGLWFNIGKGVAKMFGMGRLAEEIEDLREQRADLLHELKKCSDQRRDCKALLAAERFAAGECIKLALGNADPEEVLGRPSANTLLVEAVAGIERRRRKLEKRLSEVVAKYNDLVLEENKIDLDENPY